MPPQEYRLTDVPQAAVVQVFEQVEGFAVLLVVVNSPVASDHLHVPHLPLSRVPEGAVRLRPVSVTVQLPRLAADEHDERVLPRRADPALRLASVLRVQVAPPVDLPHNERWHQAVSNTRVDVVQIGEPPEFGLGQQAFCEVTRLPCHIRAS